MLEGYFAYVDGGGCGRMECEACLGWMWARSFALLVDDWRATMAADDWRVKSKHVEIGRGVMATDD